MACPTCGHHRITTGVIGDPTGLLVTYCHRCGSMKEESRGFPPLEHTPRLVDQAREIVGPLHNTTADWSADGLKILIDQSGILESIHPPGDRK